MRTGTTTTTTRTKNRRYETGSRKAQVFDTFREKGPEAAVRAAIRKGYAPATAATYVSCWKNKRDHH